MRTVSRCRPNTRETSRMLIPSTITARRTRRYTSTWYIHPTTHKHDFEPMDGRGRYIFQPPQCQAVNPSRWSTLPPPFTAALSAGTDAPGPPSPDAGPDSWTGPLRQEIPLHLQLSDLLVQAGDQRGIASGLLVLTVAEDPGGALHKGFLPGLNLAGMDLVPAGQLGHRILTPHRLQGDLALKAGLCFLRPWDISHSFLAATAALSLGAGLSLSHLSSFLSPPHVGRSSQRVSVYLHAQLGPAFWPLWWQTPARESTSLVRGMALRWSDSCSSNEMVDPSFWGGWVGVLVVANLFIFAVGCPALITGQGGFLIGPFHMKSFFSCLHRQTSD